MGYPGYSENEYISEVSSILSDRFGVPAEAAYKLVANDMDVRHYNYGPRSPSPSALANRIGKSHRLTAKQRVGPPMESGYAYKYMGRGQWEDVVVSDNVINNAKFEGFGTIYGNRMAVWKVGRHSYAQTAVGPRHESLWVGKHGDKQRSSRRSRRSRAG